MSKDNLQVKPEVSQTVETPKAVTPTVFRLKPLRIEQPIEIIQSVSLTGPEQPEEPKAAPAPAPVAAPAPEAPKKAKCKVRKAQKFWFVVTLLLVAAFAAAFALYAPFYNFLLSLRDSNAANDYAAWTPLNHGLNAGLILFVAFVVSVLVRFILHPFACKTRKGKGNCCKRCERKKFFWALLVFGLAAFALDAFVLKFLSTEKAIAGLLAFNMFALIGFGAAALVFILLVITSIAHRRNHKRQAKAAAAAEYDATATGIYEDINSPYNAYKNNKKASKRKGSKFGKFLKVLLALVVLVVAYAAVAYFVPQVPGHDFVAGLLNR